MTEKEQKTLIEKWGTIAGALTAIVGFVFLIFPGLKPDAQPILPERPLATASEAESGPARLAPGDVIIGTWQQYIPDRSGTAWEQVGTFVVTKSGGAYLMSAREQRDGPSLLNSIGIFDVHSDGVTWTFNSNWGGGRVGNFSLQRMSNTSFEGTISEDGQVVIQTRWIRTQ